MAETQPTQDEWHKLFEAAIRLKELAPWEWMTETDVFGVQNPETDEMGFVSLMGMQGQHLALALYLGVEGLARFWHFEEMADSAPPETLFYIPHLQASFEDRNDLSERDRRLIKELGFKFRGRQAWPAFRSFRPGFFPWHLEAAEARFLTHALDQAVELGPRFKENPRLLPSPEGGRFLVRVPRQDKGTLAWADQVVTLPPPEQRLIPVMVDGKALRALRQMPRSPVAVEVDFSFFPARLGERGERPRMAHVLLVVEGSSGFVLGSEFLEMESSEEELWGRVPAVLLGILADVHLRPRQLHVQSPLLAQVLGVLAGEIDLPVKLVARMPRLEEAKEFMLQPFV